MTRSTSYMRESFVEGLRWKSVPQRKVAAQFRSNVLYWRTSEAYKNCVSAVVMAAAMTYCSNAILAAKGIQQMTQLQHRKVYYRFCRKGGIDPK